MTDVLLEIASERKKQVKLGFDAAHDDAHTRNELAMAAVAYIINLKFFWPWDNWWKPKTYRKNLIRAASFLVAEIERLDRNEIEA